MSKSPQKMKMNKIAELQKELEFYTNLLAQHEKVTGIKSSSPHCPSASTHDKRSNSKHARKAVAYQEYNNKLTNIFSKNTNSFPPNDSKMSSFAKKCTPLQKRSLSTAQLLCSVKVKPISQRRLSPNSVKIHSPKSTKYLNSTCIANSANMVSPSSVDLLCKQKDTQSDSQKLMGEIMSITKQLKSRSENLSASNKLQKYLNLEKDKGKMPLKSVEAAKISKLKKEATKLNVGEYFNPKQFLQSSASKSKLSQAMHVLPSLALLEAECNKKHEYLKNVQMKTTHLDMLKKLNAIEKVLSHAKDKKPSQIMTKNQELTVAKSNHLKKLMRVKNEFKTKTTMLTKELNSKKEKNSVPMRLITEHNRQFDKNSPSRQCPRFHAISSKIMRVYQNTKFCSGLGDATKCKFSSMSCKSTPTSAYNTQFNPKYKVNNKIHTPMKKFKLLQETKVTKSLKKSKLSSNTKKKCPSTFKLINESRLASSGNATCKISATANTVKLKSFPKNVPPLSHNSQRVSNIFYQNSHSFISKYRYNKATYSRKYSHLNTPVLKGLNNSVDVDLLLELAAEKKKFLFGMYPVPQKRILYKSKNTIINNHSVQTRTARMIKSKYFAPSKRLQFAASKHFKGNSRNSLTKYSINGKRASVGSNKYARQKNIYLRGEKFIVGSSGKTLRKITKRSPFYPKQLQREFKGSMKTVTPVTKSLASRALNRSINRMLYASAKKTRKVNSYCKFYNRFGRCNKGIKCPYVHDPGKIAVCTRFLRGTCKNKKCLFSHEISPGKMAICSFFLQDSCTKSDCPYRHEKLSPDAELCKAFVQGYCPNGKECKKAHILICPKYVQGLCEKGKYCAFPHPLPKAKKEISNAPVDTEDPLLERVNRYFECEAQGSEGKSLVVPRIKTLPQQPSFISLTS